jgi:hypothetical protein
MWFICDTKQRSLDSNDINSILFDDDSDSDSNCSKNDSIDESNSSSASNSSTNNRKRRSNSSNSSSNSSSKHAQADTYDSERGLDYRKQYPFFVKGALTLRTHAQVSLTTTSTTCCCTTQVLLQFLYTAVLTCLRNINQVANAVVISDELCDS